MGRLLVLVLGLVVVGCGGLVVLQLDDGETHAGGRGGDGGAIGPVGGFFSPPADVVTTGPGSDACASLLETLETAIDHARACSPLDPSIQCDGTAVLLDTCGCPSIVANEDLTEETAAATAAYQAWVEAGCGPYRCDSCTEATNGGFCEAMGDPAKGRCAPNPP